jgi:hypothetical protein
VCKLATEADAILGTDFLLREGVTLQLDQRKIFLNPELVANSAPFRSLRNPVNQTELRYTRSSPLRCGKMREKPA